MREPNIKLDDHNASSPLKSRIGRKITSSIIIFATTLAIITTGAQLFGDYHEDKQAIIQQINNIETTLVQSISKTQWSLDHVLLKTQLQGIMNLPDMQFVRVENYEGTIFELGEYDPDAQLLYHEYPLTHPFDNTTVKLGTLVVAAKLDRIQYAIMKKAGFVLILNFTKTFLVAIFILFIIRHLITKHIEKISHYLVRMGRNNKKKLVLDRKPSPEDKLDELDLVTQAISQMEEEQEKLALMKDQFLANAAHELKTPLTVIKGHTQLLTKQIMNNKTANQLKTLKIINNQCENLSMLIQDLLEISRLQLDQRSFNQENVDIKELIINIVEQMSGYSEKHRIDIKQLQYAIVSLDRKQISQVVYNLLSNAINYSPEGGIIEIDGSITDEHYKISITDHGIGIPKDQQKSIFKKFFRAHLGKETTISGMGVGLFISREYVEQHGGNVWFTSIEGEGSVFNISLPIQGAPA